MGRYEIPKSVAFSFMPNFLPDETLYSLCARFHSLSGNRLAATSSRQLFGVATAAMLHDFPTNLSTFEMRTEGRLGDTLRLACERTLLGFYAPYQPQAKVITCINAMAGTDADRLKFRLGLPSSRIGATHPLKACAKCIQDELEQLGCAYWHVLHQHPSIWICSRHDELLMRSTAKSKTHNKLQWLLPHSIAREDWRPLPEQLKRQAFLLTRIEEFVRGMSAAGVVNFDPSTLRQCYLFAVRNSGWLTRNGNVRLKAVRQAFIDQVIGLAGIPEFDFIESADREDGGFLGKLLRASRSNLHPSKHLIVKVLLFTSWSEFWSSYLKMSTGAYDMVVESIKSSEEDSKVNEFLSLIELEEISLAQAARTLGLPYDVARYWLKRAGIRYVRPDVSNIRHS